MIYDPGKPIKIGNEWKSQLEVRQKMYESIIDETLFISRASEGAVSAEWLMEQPIFIRKKYVESFTKELEQRKQTLEKSKRQHSRK